MKLLKLLFRKKPKSIKHKNTKDSEVFLHFEKNRVFLSSESPEIKKWCDKQLKRNKHFC